MTHDETITPTPIDQVPLGWELLADFGADEPEARTLQKDPRNRDITLLVIGERGEWSVWICRRPLWPFA